MDPDLYPATDIFQMLLCFYDSNKNWLPSTSDADSSTLASKWVK